MSAKPTVLFVPGAWHTPETFQEVADHLISAGYGYTGVDKPSVSLGPDYVQSFDPDVDSVRDAITKASDAGNDVVLVMHSYGGIPGSEGTKGLRKEDRAKVGKKGGVVRLVYIAAFAIDEGQSLLDAIGGSTGGWTKTHGDYMVATDTEKVFYADVAPEVQKKCIAKLQHQATKSFASKLTYPAWKYIPSTYVICEEDQAIPSVAQEAMSSQEGGIWTVERLKTSHSPFLSAPKDTADAIRRAAGEKI